RPWRRQSGLSKRPVVPERGVAAAQDQSRAGARGGTGTAAATRDPRSADRRTAEPDARSRGRHERDRLAAVSVSTERRPHGRSERPEGGSGAGTAHRESAQPAGLFADFGKPAYAGDFG